MKSFIALSDSSIIWIIALTTLIISVILVILIKRKIIKKLQFENSNRPTTYNLLLKESYCSEDIMNFLSHLHQALPKECIAFPIVSLDRLVVPTSSKAYYNKLISKQVDICVFLRHNMQPILVVDLLSQNPIERELKQLDDDIVLSLKSVELNIVKINIETNYNLNILRQKLIEAMPKKVLIYLKDNLAKK